MLKNVYNMEFLKSNFNPFWWSVKKTPTTGTRNVGEIELSSDANKIDIQGLSEGYYFLKIESPLVNKLMPFIKTK